MKITIAYIPSEAQEADTILHYVRSVLPNAKVRRSTAHPPHICIYLTTKPPFGVRSRPENGQSV